MHNFSVYSLALALASVAQGAPAPAAPVSIFSVKDFHTVCTETLSEYACATNFNVTYSNSPSYHCYLDGSETDYVYCQNPGPEASIAAYIQETKIPHGSLERTLKLRYELAFPGKTPEETYGSKILNKHQSPNFGVIAT